MGGTIWRTLPRISRVADDILRESEVILQENEQKPNAFYKEEEFRMSRALSLSISEQMESHRTISE
jgi:hypothetical protein